MKPAARGAKRASGAQLAFRSIPEITDQKNNFQMIPGPQNAITDVPRLRVGHAQDDHLKSGVSVGCLRCAVHRLGRGHGRCPRHTGNGFACSG